MEAEREKERQENALQHIQTLSEKTIKKLDEEISAKNMTLECTDALIEIRKNDVAEWEEKAEYSKSEYLKADELLTDKKKEVELTQGELSRVTEELDEATRKKEIALDLYHRLSTDTENTDLFDKVVDLTYENEQLRSKIQVLQDKLEKAYEELADKTLRYINLKKLVPSTTRGMMRRDFAQELMEFADDTLQEVTQKPELESKTEINKPAEIEAPEENVL